MYLLYSLLLSIGFALMLPLFILRRERYAAGFRQRLGNYPPFLHDGRPVIWLHCVSVGETNAAHPLVDGILRAFPGYRLIVSTTTKTGQELAQNVYAGKADAVFYFPFDWKFSVRKALENYKPSLVLLMETEIWPRFIREAKMSGAAVAIVNGRLSEDSSRRYGLARPFIKRVLAGVDRALVQTEIDARRMNSLGLDPSRIIVTGNLKFDLELSDADRRINAELDERFRFSRTDVTGSGRPVVVAASTHRPEERWVLEAFCSVAARADGRKPRLLIAPRHPGRFDAVARIAQDFSRDPACGWPGFKTVRRSEPASADDAEADVIILDSIGELRAVYSLADIVFVGGSLIPHGGQSILEPAAAGRPVITGYHTGNFADVVRTFLGNNAVVQIPPKKGDQISGELFLAIDGLLENDEQRRLLGSNAAAVMRANRGAATAIVNALGELLK